jgi:HK97 family phage major capsid protein
VAKASPQQLRNERADLVKRINEEARPLHAKVGRGERLSAAEQRTISDGLAKVAAIDAEIRDVDQEWSHPTVSGQGQGEEGDAEERAFTEYLRTGRTSPELQPGEFRAAGEATGSAGGYTVPPGWWQRLQVALKAYGGTMADFELIETDTGQPMQWATNDPTSVVASVIAENTQISDVDYVFGQGTLGAYMFSGGVHKVSRQLFQDSAFNLNDYVQRRVAESLGRAEAAKAISGTGSNEPLGIITALNASSGLTSGGVYTLGTGNKVNVIGSGTAITSGTSQVTELLAGTLNPNTFLAIIRSVDKAYRALGAKWYMNDTTLQNTKAIANSFGEPFFKELQDDTNPTLYGYQVVVDNNIPALAASTASGLLFGHMESAMVLRRVKGGSLLRLEERYADFLQVGYIGYERIDTRSNDMRAAVVVKASTS